ncbi:MAG: hypothetical protein H6719_13760 [Sandaracinaceae bacterium]|nr:hypothetical protein [Sandaracinaceae bacterium]
MRKNTSSNTAAWKFQVWASFVVSTSITGLGVLYLPVDLWTKGFLAMGLLFTVGSCFGLAKTVRDDHEAELQNADPNRAQPAHPFRSAA